MRRLHAARHNRFAAAIEYSARKVAGIWTHIRRALQRTAKVSRHAAHLFEDRSGYLVAVALLLFTCQPAVGLDPQRPLSQCLRRIWQVQQGLPQATIFSICQSKDGYIWLGTRTGLVRFDGLRFTSIHERGGVSLENVWVQDLCVDDSQQFGSVDRHRWVRV